MKVLELNPIAHAEGTVRLPGSKSISNRVLLLAALASGTTLVRDLLEADDTRVMLAALAKLGVSCKAATVSKELGRGLDVSVHGGGGRFSANEADLFLGNAGTAIRPLTASLALAGGDYRLSGVPRMHERPIGDLVDALRAIGAEIDYTGNHGYPPLHIRAGNVRIDKPVRVRGDVSSQFLTALLLALPLAGPARIEVDGELISKPYVEITLRLLERFGVEVKQEGWRAFEVPRAIYASPGEIHVEGDASAASYFLAAGAISSGPVRVEGVGRASIQGDVAFTQVVEAMGGEVSAGESWIEVRGPRKLRAIDMDMNHIPDAAMTAAVMTLFADGASRLRNIGSWRVKETDRITAMAAELAKLGAKVESGNDWLAVTPPAAFTPNASIDTYDDHRMAMCFSLVALGGVPVRINDPDCVSKTFPEYFSVLASLVS